MKDDRILEGHINEIIHNNEIKEQKHIQIILKNRGFDIPQATLSRKMKKLKITKINGIYKFMDIVEHALPLIIDLQVSDFGIIVMHTKPGQAGSLGYYIDNKYVKNNYPNKSKVSALGTLAGDDTLLIVIKDKTILKSFLSVIFKDFPYLERLKSLG